MGQNADRVIRLLYAQDNLAKPLSEFVGLMNSQTQENQLASEIIRDLTKQIFHNDSSHETVGIKNVAKFLSKLSKQAPRAVYQNIGSLLGFFDCESYLLRQSLIKILSNVIQRVLSPQELDASSMSDQQRMIYHQTKEKFFELLLKRFLDKSSFCRSKVIKVFYKLTEENLVPRDRYLELFSCVVGRFQDVTVLVRKHALKLFDQLVQIFGIIFNVDRSKNETFLQLDQVSAELLNAGKEYE